MISKLDSVLNRAISKKSLNRKKTYEKLNTDQSEKINHDKMENDKEEVIVNKQVKSHTIKESKIINKAVILPKGNQSLFTPLSHEIQNNLKIEDKFIPKNLMKIKNKKLNISQEIKFDSMK